MPLETAKILALQAHGGDRRSEQGSIPTLKVGRGREYDVARLDRYSPELAAEVRAGNLSANAAAIQAGFRKKPSPFEIARRQVPKLTLKSATR